MFVMSFDAAMALNIPSAADPGRLERELEAPALPKSEPGTEEARPSQGDSIVAPQGAEKLHFVLQEIVLEGMHHYPTEVVLADYRDWVGTTITLKQIYDVANAISRRYRNDGYAFVTVSIPHQEIADGKVRIHVVEGYVVRTVLEGVKQSKILKDAQEVIVSMRPLHVPTLEEMLLQLNDLSGLNIKSVIEEDMIDGVEGGLILKLTGERTPVEASVNVDNSGSRYAGPFEGTAQAQYNDQFVDHDKTTILGLTSFSSGVARYVSIQHTEPIDLWTTVGASVNIVHNAPGYKLTAEEIRSSVLGLALNVRNVIIRSRAENLSVNGALDAHDLASNVLGTVQYRDRIRAARIGGSYDTVDGWQGVNLITATLSHGLNTFNARHTGAADLSRRYGRSDFNKMEWSASHLQNLGDDVSVYALTNGQYATTPLLASEQYGFGGQQMGRGYDSSEITGDRGVAASVELRYGGVPDYEQIKIQPYIFYDIGKVWNLSPGGVDLSAASMGVGARYALMENISMSTVLAWPLTHQPSAPISGHAYDPRLLVSLVYNFNSKKN